MPSADDQSESQFDRASSELNDGLKTCRAVVDNYRAMIGGDRVDGQDGDQSRYMSTTGSSESYDGNSH